MGLYSRLLEADAEIEDLVQDPNDTGVDLDAVEDAVMDSHDAEMEYVADVESSDPIEEAYMIMYESEYNYNQIIKNIAINELSCASRNREFVLERVDIKSMFKSFKDWLLRTYKAIVRAFKNFINKIQNMFKNNKKFASSNEKAIKEGEKLVNKAGVDTEIWDIKKSVLDMNLMNKISKADAEKMAKFAKDCEDDLKKDQTSSEIAEKYGARESENYRDEILNSFLSNSGIKFDSTNIDTKVLLDGIKKYVRGEDKVSFSKCERCTSAEYLINILKNGDKITSNLSSDLSKIKAAFNKDIQSINKMEKAALKITGSNSSNVTTICAFYTGLDKFSKNLYNIVMNFTMGHAKLEMQQARRIANMYISAYKARDRKNDKKSVGESASVFDNIQFM